MTFDEILEQVIALLKRQGRMSYSALRRRFDLDDAYLADLKDELLFTYPVTDEDDRGLSGTVKLKIARSLLPNLTSLRLSLLENKPNPFRELHHLLSRILQTQSVDSSL